MRKGKTHELLTAVAKEQDAKDSDVLMEMPDKSSLEVSQKH